MLFRRLRSQIWPTPTLPSWRSTTSWWRDAHAMLPCAGVAVSISIVVLLVIIFPFHLKLANKVIWDGRCFHIYLDPPPPRMYPPLMLPFRAAAEITTNTLTCYGDGVLTFSLTPTKETTGCRRSTAHWWAGWYNSDSSILFVFKDPAICIPVALINPNHVISWSLWLSFAPITEWISRLILGKSWISINALYFGGRNPQIQDYFNILGPSTPPGWKSSWCTGNALSQYSPSKFPSFYPLYWLSFSFHKVSILPPPPQIRLKRWNPKTVESLLYRAPALGGGGLSTLGFVHISVWVFEHGFVFTFVQLRQDRKEDWRIRRRGLGGKKRWGRWRIVRCWGDACQKSYTPLL